MSLKKPSSRSTNHRILINKIIRDYCDYMLGEKNKARAKIEKRLIKMQEERNWRYIIRVSTLDEFRWIKSSSKYFRDSNKNQCLLLRVYLDAQQQRLKDLLNSSLDCYKKGNLLSGIILNRHIFETSVSIYFFIHMIERILAERDADYFLKFTKEMMINDKKDYAHPINFELGIFDEVNDIKEVKLHHIGDAMRCFRGKIESGATGKKRKYNNKIKSFADSKNDLKSNELNFKIVAEDAYRVYLENSYSAHPNAKGTFLMFAENEKLKKDKFYPKEESYIQYIRSLILYSLVLNGVRNIIDEIKISSIDKKFSLLAKTNPEIKTNIKTVS